MFEDSEVGIALKLDKDVIAMIEKFPIEVENREVLNFILHRKRQALSALLRRGRITDKTIKKYNI